MIRTDGKPTIAWDRSSDMIGARVEIGEAQDPLTLVVTGPAANPNYVNVDLLDGDGKRVGQTVRNAALLRKRLAA